MLGGIMGFVARKCYILTMVINVLNLTGGFPLCGAMGCCLPS